MIAIMIKSAIVLVAAACIAGLLRRQSAALRHAVWTAGLLGALLVPLCSMALPAWRSGAAEWVEQIFRPPENLRTNSSSSSTDATDAAEASAPPDSSANSSFKAASSPTVLPSSTSRWSLWNIALTVWLGGAVIGLLLMLLGALRLAWVAIHSVPVTDARWLKLAEEVRSALGFRRPVRLLQSPSSRFLGTWGIAVPRVLLPCDSGGWSDERAWMVLGHELAHIKRHDWVVQVLAEATRAIYWFNPMFWLAYSRLRRESEQACDDSVIRMGAAGDQYAEELLNLARSLRSESGMRSPILAMAQPSHLERRLVAVLDPALNRLAATPWSIVLVALVAVGLTLPLAAIRAPEKVAEPEPSVAVPPPVAIVPAVEQPVNPKPKVELKAPELPSEKAPTEAARPIAVRAELPPPVAAPLPFECTVTPSVQAIKMKAAKEPLGSGPWRINDDRTIWTWDQPYIAGTAVNTMWMKPDNTDLAIDGRRLDGESAPLQVRVAKDSTAGYIATSLLFPKAGCWEVTATAGDSKLRFVTRVEPQ